MQSEVEKTKLVEVLDVDVEETISMVGNDETGRRETTLASGGVDADGP